MQPSLTVQLYDPIEPQMSKTAIDIETVLHLKTKQKFLVVSSQEYKIYATILIFVDPLLVIWV